MRYQGARLDDEERRRWVEGDVVLRAICEAEMRVYGISRKEWIKRNRKFIDLVATELRECMVLACDWNVEVRV